ncbi:hypothetical protein COT29_00730 [Candidatus Micrarchaeota archaeon CG08_land_8_20_14_0_20_59_11]|nr:MAG: hypothetical protein COT29_00730 [Candidatus Micrarchaeota archaeon CG08_land_8_20_14_0_20_59_11]
MAALKVTLEELRDTVRTNPPSPQKEWTYAPIFTPVDTEGKAVMKVIPRQDFMNENLGTWRMKHIGRFGGIACGILALVALQYSILLSAGLAIAAGWLYGTYKQKSFWFDTIMRKRDLLEGT